MGFFQKQDFFDVWCKSAGSADIHKKMLGKAVYNPFRTEFIILSYKAQLILSYNDWTIRFQQA